MKELEYNGMVLNYKLERKNRKTISIRVTERCEVEVSAPAVVKDGEIRDILIKKWDWIHEVLRRRGEASAVKEIAEGDRICLLGVDYPIRLVKWDSKDISAELKGDGFYIYINSDIEKEVSDRYIKAALRGLYIQRAKRVFRDRVIIYSEKMKLYPQDIRVKGQKSLWGSCSSRNNLNFNYKLLLAPLEILDYVVIHELAHIKHKNHSREFWGLVEKYVPDYREKRDWLKSNGHVLNRLEDKL